ncbi:hypothetical protein Tco_1118800 [Tanacetum coccineum]
MIPGGIAILTALVESDNEVKVVFDETPNLRILTSGKDGSDKGYGTNSLLEQRRDSYPDNDDYDPYDDDMYENHDMSEHLQSICDDLDITRTKDLIDVAVTVGPADDDHLVTFNSNSSTASTTFNQKQWSFLILLMSLLHAFID